MQAPTDLGAVGGGRGREKVGRWTCCDLRLRQHLLLLYPLLLSSLIGTCLAYTAASALTTL
jgi:hypothetical protein